MVLYLSSNKFGNNNYLKEWVSNHNNKLLLITNALDYKDEFKKKSIIKEDTNYLEEIGFEVTIIDLKDYFDKNDELDNLCKEFNSFCVVGGNVFILREAMKYSGFDNILKRVSNNKDYLYIGYSAGSIVLSKNLELFKEVDEPTDFYNRGEVLYDGLGLIDYVFIPHYKSSYHKAYLIDEVVNTCKNNNISYKALTDGEVVIENRED